MGRKARKERNMASGLELLRKGQKVKVTFKIPVDEGELKCKADGVPASMTLSALIAHIRTAGDVKASLKGPDGEAIAMSGGGTLNGKDVAEALEGFLPRRVDVPAPLQERLNGQTALAQ